MAASEKCNLSLRQNTIFCHLIISIHRNPDSWNDWVSDFRSDEGHAAASNVMLSMVEKIPGRKGGRLQPSAVKKNAWESHISVLPNGNPDI